MRRKANRIWGFEKVAFFGMLRIISWKLRFDPWNFPPAWAFEKVESPGSYPVDFGITFSKAHAACQYDTKKFHRNFFKPSCMAAMQNARWYNGHFCKHSAVLIFYDFTCCYNFVFTVYDL